MAYEREIAQALDTVWLKSLERSWIPGRLGVLTSSTPTYDVEVTDRDGYVYVSLGVNGERGQTIAHDKVGVDVTAEWQEIRLRYEFGELVIREATTLSGSGGGGGVVDLDDLGDVVLTSLADGHALEYDSGSATWINVVPAGGAGGSPSPHGLSSVYHSGLLDWADIDTSGSNLTDIATRAHASLQGITANDHHNQVHSITGSDHTITASQYQVVGATATNTLGLLTSSDNPGATSAILRTNANGGIAIDTSVFVVSGSNNTVTMGTTLFALDTDTSIVTIDTNLIYADGANNRVGINQTPGAAALDVIAANNADHTQRLKQKSGQTGRIWRVEDTSGDELIVLDSQGSLQSGSPGFVSGLTGWQITATGNAEFNNIWARGELHATVFVKDEIHATGGTFFVATAGKLYSDAALDDDQVDTENLQFEQGSGLEDWEIEQGSGTEVLQVQTILNYIEIDDPPSGPGFYFDTGDVVRSKTEVPTGVTDFWLEILHGVQLDGYSRYSVIVRSGTDGTLPAGSAVVSYGVEGDGRILMTSDLNYAPYIDVFTVGPNVWTGAAGAIIPHMRLGRLDGVGVTLVSGIEQYGMIAGTDLSDANSPYIVASNLQLALFKVDLTLNDGTNDTGEWTSTGNLTIGTNIATTNGTSFQVITTGANAGDVIIGRVADEHLRWDQSTATLTINGTLIVGGSPVDFSDLATTTYVDTAESDAVTAAAADATNKADVAYANAQSYTNAVANNLAVDIDQAYDDAEDYADTRRIVGVSGTWTSTDLNTITWASVSIRNANGETKSVNNGNTGNMGALTYIYVDLSDAAPLTLSTTTSLASIAAGDTIVAIAQPGTEAADVQVIGGRTYISGDSIITGSVTATQIKAATITASQIATDAITSDKILANAVTAAKINVSSLAAVSVNTGNLDVTGTLEVGTGSSGVFRAEGKTGPNDTTNPGFWMGYSGGEYQFIVGDTSSGYMQHNGIEMGFLLRDAMNIAVASGSDIFNFVTGGAEGSLGLYVAEAGFPSDPDAKGARMLTDISFESTDSIHANKFDQDGDTLRVRASRTPASASATGFTGEWCWDTSYIYVCTATDTWKRAALSTW